MPAVSYNGQSFNIDGRRVWILGASLQYTRIAPAEWPARIADARQAGFNTIETACPWSVHEPRKGRYHFQDQADIRQFIGLCAEAGMRVILRPGPFVGSGFDGGGLPSWLVEDERVALREGNEAFLERVTRYFRKLLAEVSDLQATKDGPLLLVQVEHAWMCANDEQADKYLRTIARIVRECGIAVPLINANNLWLDPADTIDTWRGDADLFVNLRQLRMIQPDAPRIVSAFEDSSLQAWNQPPAGLEDTTVLRRLAEVLAAGAQPIVSPFHGGTNFGFLGGRLPGPRGGAVTTSAAAGAPLGEAGARGSVYRRVRPLITFAAEFAHVFADLDPDYHPVTLDPTLIEEKGGSRSRGGPASIVALRGAGGRVAFVFAGPGARATTLLLDAGIRLPVDLGDQPVGWYVLDVDLRGQGRLDYANLCPFAIVDRSIVVLHGPQRMRVYLSVNGTPFQATVPTGPKPLVVDHKGVRIVILNQKQRDVTYHDGKTVFVGVDGFDLDGNPHPAAGVTKPWAIDNTNGLHPANSVGARRNARGRRTIRLSPWRLASASDYAEGTSPRYASLDGPRTLPECGASEGYGWYRVSFRVTSGRKRRVIAPRSSHRIHVYAGGELVAIHGDGPGAEPGPFEFSLSKGTSTVTVLADNFGRFSDGNDIDRKIGLYGHFYGIKTIAGGRPKTVTATPVDPFDVRACILGATRGQRSDTEQVEWSFTHARKTPILLQVLGAVARGAFVLNGTVLTYYAGETGAAQLSLLLDPSECEPFKRGRNVLRFAPDAGQTDATKDMIASARLYECTETLTKGGEWAFAKWEPPAASRFKEVAPAAASRQKGTPAWWRSRFPARTEEGAHWLNLAGLSKGQAYVNGRNLGRYFTAIRTSRAVGPQQRLYMPASWLHTDADNEVLLFDEHGFSPSKVKVEIGADGDLD